MPREPLRFIHASNLRLDRPPAGTGPLNDADRRVAEDATLIALQRMASACLEHDTDFLLLSGPTFDQRLPTVRAQAALRIAAESLAEFGIQVILCSATHSHLPDNVRLVNSAAAGTVAIRRGDRTIASLRRTGFPPVPQDNRTGFQPVPKDGRTECQSVPQDGGDPTAVIQSADEGWKYVAVDGASRTVRHSESGVVHSPGPAVGLTPRETGPHGCTLIEVGETGEARLRMLPTSPLRWERLPLSLDPETTRNDLIEHMQLALLERTRPQSEDLWFVRWMAVGDGPLFDALRESWMQDELWQSVDHSLHAAQGPRLRHQIELRPRLAAAQEPITAQCLELIDQFAVALPSLLPCALSQPPAASWASLATDAASRLDRHSVVDRARRFTHEWLQRAG